MLLILLPVAPVFGKTFTDILGTGFTNRVFGDPFARAVSRSLPLISASSGVVFTFDPTTGAFERETSIVGQLFLERAVPLGRGRWNMSLSYQRVKFDGFEGEELEELSDAVIDPMTQSEVVLRRFSLDLDTHELTASTTYGVSEDLDVNLTVPVLFSEFREKVLQEGMAPFANGAAQVGVGDIFLRGKNRIVSRDWLQAALGLVLRLPAGNEDNFQGTGDFEVAPMLYATTRRFHPGGSIHLLPYLNAGVDFDAQSVGSSEARWGLGLDCGLGEAAVVAIAVLARHAFQRLLPPGFTSFRHTDGSIRPLFGIEGGRPDIYDFSIGGRVNLWRDTVMVFANAVVPLNEDGIRATVIPTAGVEVTF